MQRSEASLENHSGVLFLRAWTRLEALIKRIGVTLSHALDWREIPVPDLPNLFDVNDVELGPDFVGAVACVSDALVGVHRVDPERLLTAPH